MMKHWCDKFDRFEGQPVRVFTDDGRVHRGILADVDEGVIRLVTGERCVEDVFICHIDAIQEPLMRLNGHCCSEDDCDEEEEEEECGRRGRRRCR